MIKKFVYIGLALLLVAFAVLFVGGSLTYGNIQNYLSQNLVLQNLTIAPHSYGQVQINVSNSSVVAAVAKMAYPANLYFFNASGFSAWESAQSNANTTGFAKAESLEGRGVYIIFSNATSVSIPPSTSGNGTIAYVSPKLNSSGVLGPGKYYIVIDNTNGSVSANKAFRAGIIILPPVSTLPSSPGYAALETGATDSIAIGVTFFILLIAALALIAYGVFKKDDTMPLGKVSMEGKEFKTEQKELDRLYKGIGDGKKHKRKKAH